MIYCKLQFKRGHRGHIVELSQIFLNCSDPQLSLHLSSDCHPETFKDSLLRINLDTYNSLRSFEFIILLIPYLSLIIFLDFLGHPGILGVLTQLPQLFGEECVPGGQPHPPIGDLGGGVSHQLYEFI
jgi:hypothetical protein